MMFINVNVKFPMPTYMLAVGIFNQEFLNFVNVKRAPRHHFNLFGFQLEKKIQFRRCY